MESERITPNYLRIFEQAPVGMVIYDCDLRVVDCNEGFAALLKSSRERIIGLRIDELRDQRHRVAVLKALSGDTITYESPYQATTSDSWALILATFAPLRNALNVIEGVIVIVSNTGESSDAPAVHPTQGRLSETERFGHIGSWTWDAERNVAAASPEFHRILGLGADSQFASPNDFEAFIYPEDRPRCLAQVSDILERRLPSATSEFRILRPDETIRWIALQADAHFAANGRLLNARGLVQDVTERRLLQERLRQAQKMESIGQLAAGIAHDFNNMLTVIAVESEILGNGLGAHHEMQGAVRGIRSAADRATGLTKQLLSFSRKQPLRRRLLEVNDTVAGALQIVARLIGEDIELLTDLTPHLPPIHADAGQLVQVLVNLAVNARDAMSSGGRLSITTGMELISAKPHEQHIPAGEYVVIIVADTGHGMDEATRRQIFEPFFTTKDLGRGTGLGLSTVYGIMEQSAGHITVASKPGKGAAFKLHFLPQAAEAEAIPDSRLPSATSAEVAAPATLLLVEDDPPIRSLCKRLLQREGYEVLLAEDGYDALGVAEVFPGRIDLLLTDMILPTLNGSEVYDRLKRKREGLRVLYMSGHAADEIVRRGLIDEEARVLEKPFAIADLVTAVREILNG